MSKKYLDPVDDGLEGDVEVDDHVHRGLGLQGLSLEQRGYNLGASVWKKQGSRPSGL